MGQSGLNNITATMKALVTQQRGAAIVLAAVGAVWCWFAARSVVTVAPVIPNEPQTTSVALSAPMLVLMLLLAAVAGVLAVVGIARRRRYARSSR